jgi:hypothetical protein
VSEIDKLVAEWRETADIWEQHEADAQREAGYPPSRSRSDVKNWINWLRACADGIELAKRRDEDRSPKGLDPNDQSKIKRERC